MGKAHDLDWPDDRIIVIDEGLGLSGSGSLARSAFARLTADVTLARNNPEWYRLIDLARFTNTLVGDADGIYHPAVFNDCLLLGLKGAPQQFSHSHSNAVASIRPAG